MDSNKIKKGLGRGLSSLIGETKIESQNNQLSISEMIPNKIRILFLNISLATRLQKLDSLVFLIRGSINGKKIVLNR